MDKPLDVKVRRKALGWTRAELAHRAGIDPRVVQLVELDQWEEEGALMRVGEVLDRAEAGELDVILRKLRPEQGAARFGDQPEPPTEPVLPPMIGGKIPEA